MAINVNTSQFRDFQSLYKADLKRVLSKFDDVLEGFDLKTRRSILRKGAAILRKEARQKAPVASEDVFRYVSTYGRSKAAKGEGRVAAVYKPSNLGKSVATMTFRRDKTGVYVGTKRRDTKALVVGSKVSQSDGYYGHMVEFGTINSAATPFMRPALAATKAAIKAKITEEARKRAQLIKRQVRL